MPKMNKIFFGVIEIIFWIAIFLSPLLIGIAIAFIIFLNATKLEWLSIIFISLGFVTGIIFAERVRRKYGCTRYMSRLLATPDIWPTDTYDKKNRKKPTSKNQNT
jgi:positive regulator of sigma E activity